MSVVLVKNKVLPVISKHEEYLDSGKGGLSNEKLDSAQKHSCFTSM